MKRYPAGIFRIRFQDGTLRMTEMGGNDSLFQTIGWSVRAYT